MPNPCNCWGIARSVAVTLVLGSMIPFPAIAQLPAFTQPGALPSTAPGVIRPVYILGPGDQIEITVFEYEEFTGPRVILPDGTITLPVIGAVPAAGRTPDTLARELTARLTRFLINPIVTVNLNTLRPILVNVAGQVQRPGPVQLRSLTTTTISNTGSTVRASLEGSPTVSSALMEAGGVTKDADIRQIVLRRSLPDGNSSTISLNLWNAIVSENAPEDLILQDGDSIFVPQLAVDDTIDRRLIASSSLAPSTVRVRVVGEVKRPGEVEVTPNSAISSAVAIAGGPTTDARLSKVVFIRLNEQGTVESQEVDLSSLNDNYQVQEGDVVIVPKKNTFSVLDFIGRFASPVNFLFNVLDQF